MTLQELRKQTMLAKKNGDKIVSNVLTMVLAETLNIAKADKNREPTDEDVSTSIKRTLKKAKQSLEYKVENADKEVAFLETLLPKSLSEDEIKDLIENIKQTTSSKGDIMKALKEIPGMDMKIASKLI